MDEFCKYDVSKHKSVKLIHKVNVEPVEKLRKVEISDSWVYSQL